MGKSGIIITLALALCLTATGCLGKVGGKKSGKNGKGKNNGSQLSDEDREGSGTGTGNLPIGSGNSPVNVSGPPVIAPCTDPTCTPGRKSYGGINGFFPFISPDGRYVVSGFGINYLTDLRTGKSEFIENRGFMGYWTADNKFMYTVDGQALKEVTVAPGPVFTTRTVLSSIPGSTDFDAADGNHVYCAPGGHLIYNGKTIMSSGAICSVSTSQGYMVHSWGENGANTGDRMRLYKDGNFIREIPGRVHVKEMNMYRGYIAYGGYGRVFGTDLVGNQVDLTVSPWAFEGNGKPFYVGEELWAGTTSFDHATGRGFIFLRPWGAKEAIILEVPATGYDAWSDGKVIIVPWNDDKGNMSVDIVDVDSARQIPQ